MTDDDTIFRKVPLEISPRETYTKKVSRSVMCHGLGGKITIGVSLHVPFTTLRALELAAGTDRERRLVARAASAAMGGPPLGALDRIELWRMASDKGGKSEN
jgi:hypothetical protein